MPHNRKSGVLLIALVLIGVLLTSAQAMDELFLAGAKKKQRGSAPSGDASESMWEARNRIYRQWRVDAELARRRRKRIELRDTRRKKRQIQSPVSGGDPYVYFPSGVDTDSKFLVLAGSSGTSSLTNEITIKLAAPSGSTALDLAMFDGDVGGANWDQGSGVMTYTLYEDGDADGQSDPGEDQISQWLGSDMANNAWSTLTAAGSIGGTPIDPTGFPDAMAPSGHHFFRLHITLTSTAGGTLSCFKVRTSASVRLEPQNSFNIIAALSKTADLSVIYPAYPSLSPTRYDGAWDLWTYVPASIDYRNPARPHQFDVWDGDLDYGHYDATANPSLQDTDDANTSNAGYPTWEQSTTAVLEGAASGLNGSSGNPPDDFSRELFRRSPSLTYDVTDPSGVRYVNTNPSGNSEWEDFVIETDPAQKNDPSIADAAAPGPFLPAGIFQLHIDGLDLTNLSAFRFEYDVLGVDSEGNPVKPLLPYLIGDTVFLDSNRNGVYEPGLGETGIGDVLVSLLDDTGNVIETTTTSPGGGGNPALGYYDFNVEAGEYTVRVEVSNFFGANPLVDMQCTTGSPYITDTVTTANVMTYDFGFAFSPSGSVGDRVWLDVDGDQVQDSGEPGIGGVTITLSEGGSGIATTTTDLNGFYLFTGLDGAADHTYTVTASGTPLTGLTQTYDSDGAGSAHESTLTLLAATSNVLQDFGYRGAGSIGDLVWNDQSAPFNTTYNPGVDVGLANVRVELTWDYDGNGSVDMRYVTNTDSSGAYLFSGLPAATNPGSYRVKIDTNTLPYGLQLIADPDDPGGPPFATASYSTLTLAQGAANLAQDFGYRGAGSIGDLVWYDDDADGVKDTGESGLSNVTVTLYGDFNHDGATDYTATTATDANGLYLFANLPNGRFRVTVSAPGTWTPTYDLDGVGTPSTAISTLRPRTSNLTYDFGYDNADTLPASVGDFVWNDTDADGVQDGGETGLANVQVDLYLVGGMTPLATQTTGANGAYNFTGLAAGDYYVKFTAPSGYALSPQLQGGNTALDSNPDPANGNTAQFALTSGQSLLTIDAGLYATAAVGDFVWDDTNRDGVQSVGETGIAGATATLYSVSGMTATQVGSIYTTLAGGAYSFTGLAPGTYRVVFTLPGGYGFTEELIGTDATIDSDADNGTGQTADFTLAAGETNNTIDAGGFQSATLGNFVWYDANSNGVQDGGETGLAGAVAKLYLSNDVLVATAPATTAPGGAYSFTGLAPGSYYVLFTLPNGKTFTTKDQTANGGTDATDSDADATTGKTGLYTLAAGETNNTVDCGAIDSNSARIGDYVWEDRDGDGVQDSADSGLSGVTVQLFNSSNVQQGSDQTTDAAGFYAFTGLAAGDYYVKFTLPSGYTFSPKEAGGDTATDSNVNVPMSGLVAQTDQFSLVLGENNPTIDAGAYIPASVGDTVWLDSDADGVQDYTDSNNNGVKDSGESGEAGVSNITVELHVSGNAMAAATTTTDADGHYSFSNVVSGDYYVKFIAAGYTFSTANAGADDTHDSDANVSTGETAVFTLSSGTNPITWDAGVYQTAAVGDFVWQDLDQDGIQDGGSETGLSGAQVKLFNSTTGLQVQSTLTTDGTGIYGFAGLTPGTYYVQVTLPTNYLFSVKNAAGGAAATDSNVNPTTSLTSATDTFTLVSGQTDNTIDAGASLTPQGSIGDLIWRDNGVPSGTARDGIQQAGEVGAAADAAASVTITLYNASNNQQVGSSLVRTMNTTYLFSGLDAGTYYITFTNITAGYALSAQNATGGTAATDSDPDPITGRTSNIVLGRGENRTDIDAGLSTTVTTASIGDKVWYDLNGDGIQGGSEPGISGVTVTLYNTTAGTNSSTTTNSSGVYAFSGLSAGTYYVKFNSAAFPGSFATAQITQADQGSDDAADSDANATTGQTATFSLANGQARTDLDCGLSLTSSLGQLVWFDYNRDGIWQSATEQGLAGVSVTLTKPNGTTVSTTTDASGLYLFSNLPPGSYTVSVNSATISTAVIPANSLYRTYDYDGFAGTPDVATYPLSAGEDVRFVNFGYSTAPKINTGSPYITFTIGGWGSDPSTYVGNPGSRLHQWFSTVYPGGVQIGRHGGNAKYIAMWETAQAVTNYLPAAGAANVLANNYTTPAIGGINNLGPNPTSLSQGGVLAAQLLAVQLDYDFSQAGGTTGFHTGLGALYYKNTNNPTLHGKTVLAILLACNQYISADTNWANSNYDGFPFKAPAAPAGTPTAANFNVALTDINQNFDNGTQDLGKLVSSPP